MNVGALAKALLITQAVSRRTLNIGNSFNYHPVRHLSQR